MDPILTSPHPGAGWRCSGPGDSDVLLRRGGNLKGLFRIPKGPNRPVVFGLVRPPNMTEHDRDDRTVHVIMVAYRCKTKSVTRKGEPAVIEE